MIEVESAAQGLIVLSTIIVVLFALWTDYFQRYLKETKKEDAELDAKDTVHTVRAVGLIAALFQGVLFLGSYEVRQEYPALAPLAFLIALTAQMRIQSSTERKIRVQRKETPHKATTGAFRGLFWLAVGGASYIGVLLSCILGSAIIAGALSRHFGISDATLVGIMVFGTALGVLGGLAFNFASGAILIRKMFTVSALEDEDIRARARAAFGKAGIPCPSLHLIESGNTRGQSLNLVFSGFPKARGWFTPGLFIPRPLAEYLTIDELDSLFRHEVSRVTLKHARKRLFLSLGMVIAATVACAIIILAADIVAHDRRLIQFLTPVIAVSSFFVTFRLLYQQADDQEFEADLFSVKFFESDPAHFSNALRKIDQLRAGIGPLSRSTPLTEKRIRRLQSHLDAGVPTSERASRRDEDSSDKAA